MFVRKLTIFESLWSLWELVKTHWLGVGTTGVAQAGALYVVWGHIQQAAAELGWLVYVGVVSVSLLALIGMAYLIEVIQAAKREARGASFSATFDIANWTVTPHQEANIRDIFFLNAKREKGIGSFDCIVVFWDDLSACKHTVTCSNRAPSYKMEMKHESPICRHVRFSGVKFPCKIDVEWAHTG